MSRASVEPDLGVLTNTIRHSVAENTWVEYSAAWNRWFNVAGELEIQFDSPIETEIQMFLCSLMELKLSYSHISKILAGVSFFFKKITIMHIILCYTASP